MENADIQSGHGSGSVIVSIIGWVVAAAVIIWFVAIGKPAQQRLGLQKGAQAQYAADKMAFEQTTGIPSSNQILSDTVNVRVISTAPGSINAEEIALTTDNPFAAQPRKYLVLYDDQTSIVRRVPLTGPEYEKRMKAAAESGQGAMTVAPFIDTPSDIGDVRPGDRIQVTARDVRALNATSFMANVIAITVQPTSYGAPQS